MQVRNLNLYKSNKILALFVENNKYLKNIKNKYNKIKLNNSYFNNINNLTIYIFYTEFL